MKLGGTRFLQRSGLLAVAGILVAVLAACTGKGGGYLPPGQNVLDPNVSDPIISTKFPTTVFTGQAPFGFTFSCEDKGGLNPRAGKLAIEVAYSDKGTSMLLSAPFSIHGVVDVIDPVLESEICSGPNPPEPDPKALTFLGRYRRTTSAPPEFPTACPTRETSTSRLCRFEIIVRDNDGNLAPSNGDYFSIKLSSASAMTFNLDPVTVFYARAGFLQGGNITVK
jgi:predicted small lipoprotein YifL